MNEQRKDPVCTGVEVRSIRSDNSNPDCIPRQTSGVISLSNGSSWQEGKTGETEAFKLIPDDSKLIIWNPVQKEGKWKEERFESLYTETRYTLQFRGETRK